MRCSAKSAESRADAHQMYAPAWKMTGAGSAGARAASAAK
jgi:hypothetical protein